LHSRTESAGQLSIPTIPLISLYQVLANLGADDTSHELLEIQSYLMEMNGKGKGTTKIEHKNIYTMYVD